MQGIAVLSITTRNIMKWAKIVSLYGQNIGCQILQKWVLIPRSIQQTFLH